MGSYYLMGVESQFRKMKKVLETDGCDACTIVRMYLMPLHWLLKTGYICPDCIAQLFGALFLAPKGC